MPADAPLGEASVEAAVASGRSKPFPIRVVVSDVGIYSRNGKGWGPGVVDNGDGSRRRANSEAYPARPGQTVTVSVTGVGDRVPGAWIGGKTARVIGVRRGKQGRDEITLLTPGDAPGGCFVPLQFRSAPAAGVAPVSNVVTIAIDAAGAPCRVPEYFPFAAWFGHRAGFAVLARTVKQGATLDEALVSFLDLRGVTSPGGPLLGLPPPGSCGLYRAALGPETSLSSSFTSLLLAQLPGSGMAAGPRLTVAKDRLLRSIPARMGATGVYYGSLGASPPQAGLRPEPLFLGNGDYRVASEGGPEVPAFAAIVPGLGALEWKNRDALGQVDRRRGLHLDWQASAGDRVLLVVALTTSSGSQSGALCYCLVPAARGSFDVPAHLTTALQATGREETAEILLVDLPARDFRTLPGIERSIAFSTTIQVRKTEFR